MNTIIKSFLRLLESNNYTIPVMLPLSSKELDMEWNFWNELSISTILDINDATFTVVIIYHPVQTLNDVELISYDIDMDKNISKQIYNIIIKYLPKD